MSHPNADDPQKREVQNRRTFSFRLNLFFFITFLIFTVLIVRLAILQFVEGPALKEKESQLGFRETAVPPLRGTIYDASNTRLAYSTASQSLYFNVVKNYGDPSKKMTDDQKKNRTEVEQLAKQLEEIFKKIGSPQDKPLTAEEILKRMDLGGKMNFVFVPRLIKSGLTKEEVAYFLEHKSQFKGIDIVEDSVRNYDKDTIAVQTVGYLKKFKGVRERMPFYKEQYEKHEQLPTEKEYLEYEDVGVDGIELMYQNELRGLNGVKKFPVNVAGRIIGPMQLTKPERGNNIHLTIHRDIQKATEESIVKTLEKIRNSSNRTEYAPNARTGYAVAMEVDTGNIVSIASMPDYDPNVWRNGQISSDDYEKIQYFMGNGAIREVYGPYNDDKERGRHPTSLVYLGSTMKPLSVLIGLKENLFGPWAEYYDKGYGEFGRKGYETKVWNSSRTSYGYMDAAKALKVSSNAFMVDMIGKNLFSLSDRNGLELWDKYMDAFGLGVKTESGMPGESAGLKDYLVEAERNNAQSALVYASFGQQGKYTTLQLAQYAATLANHGQRIKPQFVSKITDGDGKVVKTFGREVLNETKFDDTHWRVVEEGMSKVNVHGFDGFPYSFYRKTGTSQQSIAGKTLENAVFIAYAPADKPKLAVAVVVPEGGYGSYGAAPIARAMFDAYDEVYGLTGTPKKKQGTGGESTDAANNNQ
ncbi:peptidoglycan glycosyltransferase [Paenibacillus alvei TS-15]|uniref:Peptidoglycan glycosyltransferase n=1 Tax=Paenibacillus alvei TS-15 TaxID=1117108 RepID=S9SRK7_PAEAL|nr:penicillin-binding transpeptidase domain-containing protein [Paenibacillus alvei]EPY08352.1 peptidoglycan glycosyltransferase [Paenibacillus alvei TS-15]